NTGIYVERKGGREYLYAAHYEGGRVRKCYLGPRGLYVLVEGLQSYGLTNLKDADPFEVARSAILKIAHKARETGKVEDVERAVKRLSELEELIRSVKEKLVEELEGAECASSQPY
ncbi:MAG: hypothetical protein QXU64_05200, partial [Thermofilaceae archaeon]